MKAALADEDWITVFTALNELRVTNKFHAGDLAENLDPLAPLIMKAIGNLRSGISKNALTLCKELFMNKTLLSEDKYCEQIAEFTQMLLPSLIKMSQVTQAFLARVAK